MGYYDAFRCLRSWCTLFLFHRVRSHCNLSSRACCWLLMLCCLYPDVVCRAIQKIKGVVIKVEPKLQLRTLTSAVLVLDILLQHFLTKWDSAGWNSISVTTSKGTVHTRLLERLKIRECWNGELQTGWTKWNCRSLNEGRRVAAVVICDSWKLHGWRKKISKRPHKTLVLCDPLLFEIVPQ